MAAPPTACSSPRCSGVLVCSTGGVGLSKLMRRLAEAGVLCNDPIDRDGLKHAPFSAEHVAVIQETFGWRPGALLYILEHPAVALASLYRRGYQREQCSKLSKGACSDLHPDVFTSISEYARLRHDLFGFQAHIESYLNASAASPDFPVVVLRSSGDGVHNQTKLQQLAFHLMPAKYRNYTNLFQFGVESIHSALRYSFAGYSLETRRQKYLHWPGFLELEALYDPLWRMLVEAVPDGIKVVHNPTTMHA